MSNTEQTEETVLEGPLGTSCEAVFEAPSPGLEQPVVVNPDVIVDQLLAGWRHRRKRAPSAPSDKAEKKSYLCGFCLLGKHRKCVENDCPCIHRQICA